MRSRRVFANSLLLLLDEHPQPASNDLLCPSKPNDNDSFKPSLLLILRHTRSPINPSSNTPTRPTRTSPPPAGNTPNASKRPSCPVASKSWKSAAKPGKISPRPSYGSGRRRGGGRIIPLGRSCSLGTRSRKSLRWPRSIRTFCPGQDERFAKFELILMIIYGIGVCGMVFRRKRPRRSTPTSGSDSSRILMLTEHLVPRVTTT